MTRSFTPDRNFITRLQVAPKIPPVIPAVPYPEEEGIYKGARWYGTALSRLALNELMEGYLSFLDQCKQIILLGREHPQVRNLALKITEGKANKAEAIHRWIHENVRYEKNPVIVMPWELIKPGASGDCKSFTCLAGAMLGIVGIPCWLKLVEIDGYPYLHIYNLGKLTWKSIDATGAYFDREVKPISGYILFEVDKTREFPPKPLPEPGTISFPEIPREMGKIALVSAIVGVVGLGIWAILR